PAQARGSAVAPPAQALTWEEQGAQQLAAQRAALQALPAAPGPAVGPPAAAAPSASFSSAAREYKMLKDLEEKERIETASDLELAQFEQEDKKASAEHFVAEQEYKNERQKESERPNRPKSRITK